VVVRPDVVLRAAVAGAGALLIVDAAVELALLERQAVLGERGGGEHGDGSSDDDAFHDSVPLRS
jgi:hypothetical protein